MVEPHRTRHPGPGRVTSGGRYPDDRERIARARQAAEALFAEPPPELPSNSRGAGPSPDLLHPGEVTTATAMPEGTAKLSVDTPPPTGRSIIPASQVAQMRLWVKYGMTAAQIAKVCGVPVGEVKRVLHKSGRG